MAAKKKTSTSGSNKNRVTSNIPSVYEAGYATPMRETGNRPSNFPKKVAGKTVRGLRTEPASVKRSVTKSADKKSVIVDTQLMNKKGKTGTYNTAKPGKSKKK